MVKIKINVDNAELLQLQNALEKMGAGSMSETASAMGYGAELVRKTWKGFAMGGALPGITEKLKSPNGGYARSIKIQRNGPFNYEVYSAAKVADWIEEGTPELDMKKTHQLQAKRGR